MAPRRVFDPKGEGCELESTLEDYGTLTNKEAERRLQGAGSCWPSCGADNALVKRPWAPSRLGSKSR